MDANNQKHTISLFVSNKPGVLIRVSLVFARRGYNIDSLVVSESNDPDFSVMNIVARGNKETLDQILKQLNKLVDVVHATDRTGEDIISRELALLKVQSHSEIRTDILQLASSFQCEILDLKEEVVVLQVAGTTEKIDTITKVFSEYGLKEVVRTGKVLMAKGQNITS